MSKQTFKHPITIVPHQVTVQKLRKDINLDCSNFNSGDNVLDAIERILVQESKASDLVTDPYC